MDLASAHQPAASRSSVAALQGKALSDDVGKSAPSTPVPARPKQTSDALWKGMFARRDARKASAPAASARGPATTSGASPAVQPPSAIDAVAGPSGAQPTLATAEAAQMQIVPSLPHPAESNLAQTPPPSSSQAASQMTTQTAPTTSFITPPQHTWQSTYNKSL